MFIDLHMHSMEGSNDSHISIPQIVEKAKKMGLDAICITDHDTMKAKEIANEYSKKLDFKIFVGAEILTYEGDILIFGVDFIPNKKLHAQELINFVNERNGATISAHPYRENNRGLEDHLYTLKGLTAIEGYNGSTKEYNNEKAKFTATQMGLPIVGVSDCHIESKIGVFATEFEENINSIFDIVDSLKAGKISPVKFNGIKYEHLPKYEEIDKKQAS